jgi:K+-sensing histidine kinase KdpD
LYWYIDSDLINGAVTNIMNNLYTYAKSAIEITVRVENNSLILQIKDDGHGYPEEMLRSQSRNQQENFSFKSSNTGLGLYFSGIAAGMHQNNGRSGFISISNDGINGGGCLSIVLP